MKILYVKHNSDRAKKFQLKTIIYEENNQKFVRKEVLCDDAIPHLQSMKKNYTELQNNIINPNVKLAKIISSTDRSIIFEYIDGISLEEKFYYELKSNIKKIKSLIDEYEQLLTTSFKIKLYNHHDVDSEYKKKFGFSDYSVLDSILCFDGLSNIDLIFSNILYKGDEIYIIDYEWVIQDCPIEYVKFRAIGNLLHNYQKRYKEIHIVRELWKENNMYKKMTNFFHDEFVCKNGFFKVKTRYLQNYEKVEILLASQKEQIDKISQQLFSKEVELSENKVALLNMEEEMYNLLKLADSMRIKNRIKKLLGLYKV